jgi:hypothetical protein
MRGEFIHVWAETRQNIWEPLSERSEVAATVYCDLYRDLVIALRTPPSAQRLVEVVANPSESREAFDTTVSTDFLGEAELVRFFEAAFDTLEELGGDEVSNAYFNLLAAFIEKYSLRYDLRRPCALCPTLPGLVTTVVHHIRATSKSDAHLAKLHSEFEESLRDLRYERTEGRIKAVLAKQFILVEGIANVRASGVGGTLGELCKRASWPHPTLKAAAGQIYGFRSDYPGLGHSGNPKSVSRELDDRDLAGVSLMLLGLVPYIDNSLDLAALFPDPTSLSPMRSKVSERAVSAAQPLTSWRSIALSLSKRILAFLGAK